MKHRLHTFYAALMLSFNCLYPQEQLPGRITRIIEDMAYSADEDLPQQDIIYELSNLSDNPVNINSQNENEIKRLFFLTEFQVKSIIDYTSGKGEIISVTEISYIQGFDRELAEIISPFIYLGKETINNYERKKIHLSSITNIITGDKDPEKKYQGSNFKFLSKLDIGTGQADIKLTMEKDAGEFFLQKGTGPDFASGSISVKPASSSSQIIIGDFRARFGQGLTVWNSFARSAVPSENRLMRGSSNIQPYGSTDENNFFRGLAFSGKIMNMNIMSFISMNYLDATTDTDEEGNKYVRSFYTGGLHNTATTLMKKNTVRENSYGININSLTGRLYYGLSAVYSSFSLPVIPDNNIRNKYDFRGCVNASVAADYAILNKYSYIFGEFAVCNTGNTAFLQGLSFNPEGTARINLLYTRINRGYNSFHGNTTGATTFNKPSAALLANFSTELNSSVKVATGLLHKKELWYNNISGNFPQSIYYTLSINFESEGKISLAADIKQRIWNESVKPERGIKTACESARTNIRLSVVTALTEELTLRSRLERSIAGPERVKGMLVYQSLIYKPGTMPVEIKGRITLFNTSGYESRIYAWEDDLLYSMTVKGFFNRGERFYLMLIYKPSKKLAVRARYSVSYSSGPEEDEKKDREVKLQAVLRF